MSSTAAIRSGELLACPAALRRAPLAVSVRMRGAPPVARGAVAVRAEATAEGVGKAKGKGAGAGRKRPASGITKPKPISPELREFVGGAAELPRTEAIKLVWAHIKGNNLQDPDNKKIIVCDDKLKKIFGGRDRVGFLEISGLLNPHFPK
ncbi:hypothetical protein SEVIR_3G371600v4 [Setaria viridis]|uniref:DM2 domain-containing protein n=2 Tax=Setaria TaxID=4554 RepID=A0A368QMV8_SETIT|nr:upstream activation factor subunit spp27 [Setaria italica]XP_034587119.1 upstream activation factor subunit spp27-like [Setaria viridis]RCV19078.1 hypothetical protein SETIT_3G355300v2 [Setaria italica]TKW29071.1 hypothetical protein SEVIR_3G371600v2 [Setaria viridis]